MTITRYCMILINISTLMCKAADYTNVDWPDLPSLPISEGLPESLPSLDEIWANSVFLPEQDRVIAEASKQSELSGYRANHRSVIQDGKKSIAPYNTSERKQRMGDRIKCCACSGLFQGQKGLKLHLYQHGNNPLICTVCNILFHDEAASESHKNKHPTYETVYCRLCCKFSSYTRITVENHLVKQHNVAREAVAAYIR